MNPDVPFKVKNKLFCVLLIEIQYCRFSLLLKKYFKINVALRSTVNVIAFLYSPFTLHYNKETLGVIA